MKNIYVCAVALLASCGATAGATAGAAGVLVVQQLVAAGKITPEQGQALIDALNAGATGHWIPAIGAALLPTIGVIFSHLKHGKTIDDLVRALPGTGMPPATPPTIKPV